MSANHALTISDLSISYPGFVHPALKDVSFEADEGTITALIGPNGSGKTTLIKSILGLLPYSGRIEVFGKPVKQMYKKIGYVPQRFSFDQTFPITVREFISIALYSYKERISSHQHHVDESLKMVDITSLADRRLTTLSGGQLQRVLLARALAHDPKLILLDEPESGVDVGGEQTFYDLLQSLVKKEKMTAVLASHELDVVYAYSDQVICLNQTMVCRGAPSKVLDQETFMKLYGRGLKFYAHDHTGHHHE